MAVQIPVDAEIGQVVMVTDRYSTYFARIGLVMRVDNFHVDPRRAHQGQVSVLTYVVDEDRRPLCYPADDFFSDDLELLSESL